MKMVIEYIHMDPEVKWQLNEIHALAKDNHRMLRAIRRDQWLGFIGRIVVWAIVLALPLYLYQQYLQPLVTKFSSVTGFTTSGPFGFPTSAEAQKLLNSFKAGQ
jgi:Trk-type K+ transport system membrane component